MIVIHSSETSVNWLMPFVEILSSGSVTFSLDHTHITVECMTVH